MRREDEELPTIIPMGEEALEELLRAARDTEVPMDDTLLLGRVRLSTETLRRMTRKAGVNKRFKRNRVKKVGRPKTHHLTKKKLKKANNRRNYLKKTKPRRASEKRDKLLPPRAEAGHR